MAMQAAIRRDRRPSIAHKFAASEPRSGTDADREIDGAALAMMLRNTPYDASLNARYYFDQQYYYMQDSYGPRSNPFLNPFNWSRFIKSLNKKK